MSLLTEAIAGDEEKAKQEARARLEAKWGEVSDTAQLQERYIVIAFQSPFCIVKRKSDGVEGAVEFEHYPRFYYNFVTFDRVGAK